MTTLLVERNYRIVEAKMIAQMEEALEYGKKLIDSELDAGLLNFIVKPIIKTFYKYWSDNDAREGTLQQIKVTLDCAKLILNNGIENEEFDKTIEEHFPIYLKGDQTYRQCKFKHKNFNKLNEITRDCFITQINEAVLFLNVKEDITTYDDIVRNVFKTKENALKSLMRQLDFNEAGIKIIEKDPSILKIPTGKNILLKCLRKGFEHTKTILVERLDNIFPSP
ncbi:MAG: hypothetical protein EU540_02280 [Promethearchaeota archaeon]|nr:MAG: hypothetical protein EU540_02280 [Candidatus Lokiarchaeota archaeon]